MDDKATQEPQVNNNNKSSFVTEKTISSEALVCFLSGRELLYTMLTVRLTLAAT